MRRLIMTNAALVAAFCVSGSLPAFAQSLTGNVGSASVTKGERGAEIRVGFDDENNIGSRAHYEQGLTDWYKIRLISAFSQPDGGDFDFRSFTIENRFQWNKEANDNSGFNGGFRLSYSLVDGSGNNDEAEVRFVITDKFADGWEWRTNLIAEMETGSGSQGGAELQTRWQITRAINLNAFGTERWRLGLETFNEFGNTRDIPDFEDQAHQIGPVIKASWDNNIYIQASLRAGVTDGADDAMMKFFIGRDF